MATLNPKQEAFVREYLVDRNATQAAIRAGYSAKTAYSQGQRLLSHAEVARRVQDEEKDAWEKVGLTLEKAVAAVNDVLDTGTPTQRLKAAEMALRRYGQFIERVEVNGEVVFKPAFRKPVED